MLSDIEKYISPLDTKRFGMRIAKVNQFEDNPEFLISQLKENGVKLVISKINAANIKLLNQLENIGFRIKDSQLTYSYSLTNFNPQLESVFTDDVIVRNYQPSDETELSKILLESFDGYGHYHASDVLDKTKCADIYRDWGIRGCKDKQVADIVIVAEYENKPVGMLSFKKTVSESETYAAGGVGAVSKDLRGKNIFKMLTVKGLLWGIENNCAREEHNVLTTNFAVNSSFSSIGFKVSNAFFTLHCSL